MHRIIRTVCAIAAEDIGQDKAARIASTAQSRYGVLLSENQSDNKALRAHTFKRIYPSIAVYESLLAEGISSEKAVWYIREYFQRFSAKTVPHIQRLIRITGLAGKMPGLFFKIAVKNFGTDAGFVYEFPESHGNEARFNIVKCPYMETCTRYGCPEITKAFCDGDDAGYGNLHPRLIWGRTKTIGRGGDCCDFLLEYKKDDP
ncbi:MAG: L-2-amino-thiazoline-4-carboxylic acid hydrolase [Saccharofermentans sp.]|nr:L-2-amino-thiazoline-4-carboxylic acid hydrolase [Saccharofermentans sp.]